jgi:hypothetical protein
MAEAVKYKPPGFTDTFTRLFSIITILFGILLFTGIMPPPFEGAENLDLYLLLLGLHGVITNPHGASSLRKLLCHLSAASATVFIIMLIVRIFINLGLVRTDF